MSPLAFLTRPVRWLRALGVHGGTISAAPNFAYDLCVRKIHRRGDRGPGSAVVAGRAERGRGGERRDRAPVHGAVRVVRVPAGGDVPGVRPRGSQPLRDRVRARARAAHRSGRSRPVPAPARNPARATPANPPCRLWAADARFPRPRCGSSMGTGTRCRTVSRDGSSSADRRPQRGTTATRRPRRPCWTTAGSTRGISAIARKATCTSPAATRM